MALTKDQVRRRVFRIVEANIPGMRDVELCFSGYAEPGYNDPESGIVALSDWNPRSFGRPIPKADNTMPRVAELLEKLGVELEWDDEWATCSQCGKLVRTSPDSYSWQRSFADFDGELLCCECILEDPTDYLESLEGENGKCETIGVDLEAAGYKKLEGDFEHGLHHGQDADPRKIGKVLRKMGVEKYLFRLDGAGQFDIKFSVYVHESEWYLVEEQRAEYDKANKRCDLSPAAACEMALKDASAKMAKLSGDGIKVAKCNPDGTADVKLVSNQDFIDGKALD